MGERKAAALGRFSKSEKGGGIEEGESSATSLKGGTRRGGAPGELVPSKGPYGTRSRKKGRWGRKRLMNLCLRKMKNYAKKENLIIDRPTLVV